MNRVGIGYDVHQLVEGRKLILGGVEIEHDRGLEGHSDADALAHAIADALLGAVGLPDIGHHFPNTDESIRGISSMEILSRVAEMVRARRGYIVNIDATVIAEAPKLAPHLAAMVNALALALRIGLDRVTVKATTNETLGFLGRGEGIAAMAVASVEQEELRSSAVDRLVV